MRSRMIAVTTGFMLAAIQPALMPVQGYILIAVLTTLFRIKYPKPYICLSALAIYGFVYASVFYSHQLASQLPEEYKRTDWRVTGVITTVISETPKLTKIILKLTHIEPDADMRMRQAGVQQIRLSWYQPTETLKPGDQVRMTVRLKPPHGQANPQAFDYEKWLFVKGIDATGYVRAFHGLAEKEENLIRHLRTQIDMMITQQFTDEQVKALFKAVTIGNKTGFSADDWAQLRQSGTVHLAVISGLHIGFIGGLGWLLGRLATRFFPRFAAVPFILAAVLAGTYLAVSGFGLPAQRAFIMLCVFLVTSWQSFHIDPWTRWWIAVALVLGINPVAVFAMGFWLSFWAVAVLILLSDLRRGFLGLMLLQLGLMIGMLPISLLFFSGVSMIAPFVNLLAIPLFSILIPVLFLHLVLSAVGIQILVGVLDYAAQLFWATIEKVSALGIAYAEYANTSQLPLVIVTLAVLIFALRVLAVSRVVALVLVLPFLLGIPVKNTSVASGVWIYDVGQGLSVLVKDQDYTLLYDTGPAYASGATAFEYSVLPHLKSMGIKRIDTLVISHDDNDHAGGKSRVFDHFAVGEVYSSGHTISAGEHLCTAGTSWTGDRTRFSFIQGAEGVNDNDRSCVLLVEYMGCRLLLPGDIGKRVEERIKDNIGPVNWLVASHHGSNSSSSTSFLNAIKPETVVFSAGYANHFNHPHPDVLKRVAKTGADMLNTADSGAVMLRYNEESGCFSQSFRELAPLLWR